MNLTSFPNGSRVWIYTGEKSVPEEKAPMIKQRIENFAREWTSHQQALRAEGGLLYNRFIVFVVDDGFNKPGGCSIDSSVRFIQLLETELQISFFKREIFHYLKEDIVKTIHRDDLSNALADGIINEETLFFDTLVQTKIDLENNFLKALKNSWQNRFMVNV